MKVGTRIDHSFVVPNQPSHTLFPLGEQNVDATWSKRRLSKRILVLFALTFLVSLGMILSQVFPMGKIKEAYTNTNTQTIDAQPGLISLKFHDEVNTNAKNQLNKAVNFWNVILKDNFGNITLAENNYVNSCEAEEVTFENGQVIYGIEVVVGIKKLGGQGGVLANAIPCMFQASKSEESLTNGWDFTVRTGVINLDQDDLENISENRALETVFKHELGHVLGLGTLWQELQLQLTQHTDDGHIYIAENGVQGYKSLGGTSSIALDDKGHHWDENQFDDELMTPLVVYGNENPISIMTVKALQDLKYVVDETKVAQYTLPSLRDVSNSLRGSKQGQIIDLSHDLDQLNNTAMFEQLIEFTHR